MADELKDAVFAELKRRGEFKDPFKQQVAHELMRRGEITPSPDYLRKEPPEGIDFSGRTDTYDPGPVTGPSTQPPKPRGVKPSPQQARMVARPPARTTYSPTAPTGQYAGAPFSRMPPAESNWLAGTAEPLAYGTSLTKPAILRLENLIRQGKWDELLPEDKANIDRLLKMGYFQQVKELRHEPIGRTMGRPKERQYTEAFQTPTEAIKSGIASTISDFAGGSLVGGAAGMAAKGVAKGLQPLMKAKPPVVEAIAPRGPVPGKTAPMAEGGAPIRTPVAPKVTPTVPSTPPSGTNQLPMKKEMAPTRKQLDLTRQYDELKALWNEGEAARPFSQEPSATRNAAVKKLETFLDRIENENPYGLRNRPATKSKKPFQPGDDYDSVRDAVTEWKRLRAAKAPKDDIEDAWAEVAFAAERFQGVIDARWEQISAAKTMAPAKSPTKPIAKPEITMEQKAAKAREHQPGRFVVEKVGEAATGRYVTKTKAVMRANTLNYPRTAEEMAAGGRLADEVPTPTPVQPAKTKPTQAPPVKERPALGLTKTDIYRGWEKAEAGPGERVVGKDLLNGGEYDWMDGKLHRIEYQQSKQGYVSTRRLATSSEQQGIDRAIDRGMLQVERQRVRGALGVREFEDAGQRTKTLHQSTGLPMKPPPAPTPPKPTATQGGKSGLLTKEQFAQEIKTGKRLPSQRASSLGIDDQYAEYLREAGQKPIQERGAGVSPASAVRAIDTLDIPPAMGTGSFTVDRTPKPKDAGLLQNVQSPLSIVDAQGKTIQRGYYERIGGPEGKAVSQNIRAAQQSIETKVNDWNKKLDNITQLIDRNRRASRIKDLGQRAAKGLRLVKETSRDRHMAAFVDLAELEKTDPLRLNVQGDLKRAVELHDELTEQTRQYIIDARREIGVDMPDDWGITEKGYFRHLFLGDVRIFKDGNFVGTAPTYAQAQKIAMDILKAEPNANVTARAREFYKGDPVVRLSNKRFWKVVGNIAEQVELSKDDILEDVRGIIGRKAAKQKFLGALLKREGYSGYSKAYDDVMRIHAVQVARTQELSKLNKQLQPAIEKMKASNLPGLAEHIEGHLRDLWGTPSKFEEDFGRVIENTPGLRNVVPNPSFALRSLARTVTGIQTRLKLDYNIRSAAVNLVQPLTTLWPHVTTKDFAALYADFLKPSTRKMLREKGVMESSSKLEGMGVVHRRELSSPFRMASSVNRGVGYLYGYRSGLKKGLSEASAHKNGMAWAEKVEFDNSVWNAPPIIRSPQGRVLGQFKGFQVKQTENIASVLGRAEGEGRATQAGRIGKFAAGQGVVGGLKSVKPIAAALGGYKLVNYLSSQFQANNMKKEDADKWAKAIYYGAPALIGQDLSGSVGLFEPPFGFSEEAQLVNLVGGPTVGMGVDAWRQYNAFRKASEEKVPSKRLDKQLQAGKRMAERLTPYTKQVQAGKSLAEGKPGSVNLDRKKVELTPFETVMRALGFTPLKQTEYYDKKAAGLLKKPQKPKKQPTSTPYMKDIMRGLKSAR